MIIKGVLQEELENSEHLLNKYKEDLIKLPKGSLSIKSIKGHKYYYLEYREKGKLKFEYKGSYMNESEINKYKDAKIKRAKYRNAISKLKKQIKFLKGALRGSYAV